MGVTVIVLCVGCLLAAGIWYICRLAAIKAACVFSPLPVLGPTAYGCYFPRWSWHFERFLVFRWALRGWLRSHPDDVLDGPCVHFEDPAIMGFALKRRAPR